MKSTIKHLGFLSLLLLLLGTGCNSNNLKPHSGYVLVPGGKVWYRIAGKGEQIPLILLHGGPGMPSYYLKSMEPISEKRPVVFYDQLGCGRSAQITDTSIMNIPHYVEELQEVVKELGLKQFYLYGQGWGTILGTEYYLAHPESVRALILASPALSVAMWLRDADSLVTLLPDSTETALRVNLMRGTLSDTVYQKAVASYFQHYVARQLLYSADLDSCFAQMGVDVYLHFGGLSDLTFNGTLRNYNITGRLGEIKIPTLILYGEYDEVLPYTAEYYQSLIPGSRTEMILNSGSMISVDNAVDQNKAISDFLDSLEVTK